MSAPTLDVLYEDEWIIAINKEAGHLVHAADHPKPDDVVVMKLVRNLVGLKIYPTHRLDRPTCGVVVFAKGRTAARALNRSFERQQVEKSYLALVVGHPQLDTWTCSEALRKEEGAPLKEATTEFEVLQRLSIHSHKLTLWKRVPAPVATTKFASTCSTAATLSWATTSITASSPAKKWVPH